MKLMILNTAQPAVPRYWGNERIVNEVSNELRGSSLDVIVKKADSIREIENSLISVHPDIVFPNGYFLIHENGVPTLQEVLDQFQVPYVGSSGPTLKSVISKVRTKEILETSNILTPKYAIFDGKFDQSSYDHLKFPVIIKFDMGAESVGMKVIPSIKQLEENVNQLFHRYSQPVVIEEFVRDIEYTVGVIGNSSNRSILPIEVNLQEGYAFRTTNAKETQDSDVARPVENMGKRLELTYLVNNVCDVFGIRDWVRMDILQDKEGNLYVIDINGVPGLKTTNPPSSLPLCSNVNLGISHGQTANAIVYEAIQRNGLPVPMKMVDLLQLYLLCKDSTVGTTAQKIAI